MKATETAVTLVSSTPTTEKENGCFREHPHFTVQNCDKEEATVGIDRMICAFRSYAVFLIKSSCSSQCE